MKRRVGQHRIGVVLFCAIAVVAFTGLTGVALADDNTANELVTAGTLSVTTPITVPAFAGWTLNGTSTSKSVTPTTFVVTDARGTGVGWSVTVQASLFANATQLGKDLPANQLSMAAITPAKVDSGSSTEPTVIDRTNDLYIDTGESAVEVAHTTASGEGMGSYSFAQTENGLTLSLPASVYHGAYSSTITVTTAATP